MKRLNSVAPHALNNSRTVGLIEGPERIPVIDDVFKNIFEGVNELDGTEMLSP